MRGTDEWTRFGREMRNRCSTWNILHRCKFILSSSMIYEKCVGWGRDFGEVWRVGLAHLARAGGSLARTVCEGLLRLTPRQKPLRLHRRGRLWLGGSGRLPWLRRTGGGPPPPYTSTPLEQATHPR